MSRFVLACALLVSCTTDKLAQVDERADASDGAASGPDASEADADIEQESDGASSSTEAARPSAHAGSGTLVNDASAALDAVAPADAELEAGGSEAGTLPTPSLASLLGIYRSWMPLESAPESISTQIAALCRAPTVAENEFAESEHGKYRFLQNWLNDSARQAFTTKQRPFPVGAAIVKEKLASGSSPELVLVARGLMVKREPGFDPAHNDWQFGYWTPEAGLLSDRSTSEHCAGCHAGAKTDYVFLDRSWRIDRDAGW